MKQTLFSLVPKSSPRIQIVGWLLMIMFCGAPACAQTESETSDATDSKVQVGIRSADGSFLPIPDGQLTAAELQKLLSELKREAKHPKFEITQLAISGSATKEHARLTAQVGIQLRSDERIRIPLSMQEATPVGPATHLGPGEFSFDLDGFQDTGELGWYLSGSGQHTLTIPLIVPVRQPVHTHRRVRLTLPAAASSQFTCTVPSPHIKVTPPATSAYKVKSTDKQSEIRIWGLGTKFDLQWSLVTPVENSTAIHVNTRMISDLTSEPVDLTAIQSISARSGSFQTLRIQLPEGVNLFDIQDMAENSSERLLDDFRLLEDNRTVVITLRQPCTDTLELKWLLEPVNHVIPGKLTYTSFLVENARTHTGEIEIIASEGFQIDRLETRDVRRTRVMTRLQDSQVATAWRYRTENFRLVLDVDEYEPRFSVSPEFILSTDKNTLQLQGQLKCRVFRGSPRELVLNWGRREIEGWTILPAETTATPTEVAWTLVPQDESLIALKLVNRPVGDFVINFSATRPIDPDNPPMDFSLPHALAPGVSVTNSSDSVNAVEQQSVTTVIFREQENTETILSPLNETTLLPYALPESEVDTRERRRAWRITSAEHFVRADITRHERVLTAATHLYATVDGDQITVEQKLLLDVQYGSSSDVNLIVPESVDTPVELLFEDQLLGFPQRTADVQQFSLPGLRTGQYTVVARFGIRIPEPGRGDFSRLTIPLVQCAKAEFDSVRVELDQSGATDLTLDDESEWRPLFSAAAATSSFQSRKKIRNISVQAGQESTAAQHPFSVRRILVRTILDGEARSRMQIEFDGNPADIPLQLNQDCECLAFWWNSVSIEPIIRGSQSTSRSLLLRIPEQDSSNRSVLTIDFRSHKSASTQFTTRHQMTSPALPVNIWSREFVWEVFTPPGQLLFDFSRAWSPRFKWFFNGLYWGRRPNERLSILSSWFPDYVDGFPTEESLEAFPSYAVGRFGPSQTLSLTTIDRGTLLLLGSGVSLVLGFVLFRLTLGQSLVVIALGVIAFALAEIFWSHPVELLLQPVGLGVLLSLLARWLNSRFSKTHAVRERSTGSFGDFSIALHDQMTSMNRLPGADDPTQIRPAPLTSPSAAGMDNSL